MFCSAEMQVAVTDNCLEIVQDDINMGLLLMKSFTCVYVPSAAAIG